jgi:hypothetical protein
MSEWRSIDQRAGTKTRVIGCGRQCTELDHISRLSFSDLGAHTTILAKEDSELGSFLMASVTLYLRLPKANPVRRR